MPARIFVRILSLVLTFILPATVIAQNAPAISPSSHPNRHIMTLLQDSQRFGNKLTIIEIDGTHIRGIVTMIEPDAIQLSVAYGTPVTRIPLSSIVDLDHPPKTHSQKVALGVLIAVSIAAIAALIAMVIKFHP